MTIIDRLKNQKNTNEKQSKINLNKIKDFWETISNIDFKVEKQDEEAYEQSMFNIKKHLRKLFVLMNYDQSFDVVEEMVEEVNEIINNENNEKNFTKF